MKTSNRNTGKNVAALVLGLFVMSGLVQAKGWTGGDDLPTAPLACDNTSATEAAKPYDGGAVKNSPDLKGKKISIIDVPKLIGIGYFNATAKGVAEGAKDLGNVTAKTDGPTKPTSTIRSR